MIEISALLLPILLSAVVVFIMSSVIHMATPWHKGDFRSLPGEDKVMDALRPFALPPGDYLLPRATSMNDMKSPEFTEKMKKGPVIVMTVLPNGPTAMGKNLILWFLYSCVVGFFAAYVAGRALAPGASYLQVFRFVGTTAFLGYSLAMWQSTIWYSRALSTTIKTTIDGLLYGLLTAGVFGWLWPR